jgi:hypothetical protein
MLKRLFLDPGTIGRRKIFILSLFDVSWTIPGAKPTCLHGAFGDLPIMCVDSRRQLGYGA